jgi:hypothetical protein
MGGPHYVRRIILYLTHLTNGLLTVRHDITYTLPKVTYTPISYRRAEHKTL